MHLGTDGFFHLTYCTNIHPGERWEDVFENLQTYLPSLKAQLAPSAPFGIGLRLSDQAASTLLEGDHLDRFKNWLDARGLYVFTLNGFPFGDFHRQVVKDQVYAPDWRTPERAAYTIRLARILAFLLPEGLEGSISTSPISYKPWMAGDEAATHAAFEQGSRHLAEVAAALVRLRETTGKHLHVDLEPEPDCLIENTAESLDFFTAWLLPHGGAALAEKLGTSRQRAERHLRDHVGLCYDTCHFALAYEAPEDVASRHAAAGIRIGKVQLSAALKVPLPPSPEDRSDLEARLRPFAESTYLHQVIERRADETLAHYADLPDALPHLASTDAREWRIHYHVPLFVDDYRSLYSTQEDITRTLDLLARERFCSHLEIETYTWDVLPPALKQDLPTSIRQEYAWVLDQFMPSLTHP